MALRRDVDSKPYSFLSEENINQHGDKEGSYKNVKPQVVGFSGRLVESFPVSDVFDQRVNGGFGGRFHRYQARSSLIHKPANNVQKSDILQ